MDPKKLFGIDQRLQGVCVYCGGPPETRDHVPPKVLLDEPYPNNLPVVEACLKCNHGVSLHEEYFACFLDCVLTGTTEPTGIARTRIGRSLDHNPRLRDLIQQSKRTHNGATIWEPDHARLEAVAAKLATGHASYELGLPHPDGPNFLRIMPISLMTPAMRRTFEAPKYMVPQFWPELGSRAMRRMLGEPPFDKETGPWISIQQNRYRYLVMQSPDTLVKIVIAEYVAIEASL